MYIADLHIHSKYSRATSADCDAPHLDLWARRKGIGLVGTGDFTHPLWRASLKECLEPAEEGLYTLKAEYRLPDDTAGMAEPPRFVLSGEISSIYKQGGKTRKVHNCILLPSLEAAEELAQRLEAIGNVHSDGRPILGLSSHDLLEIALTVCPEAVFVPAHIWTPHFSLFGAFSGFDTLEECFGELTPHIRAVETGLSSDPPMNWRVSALDGLQLISNSDAHSPQKLGREGTLIDGPLSFAGMARAIQTGEGLAGTLEFFPEEGKYHLDGHRNCGLSLSPEETIALGGVCPVCGKKITIGVEHRVEELADRPRGASRPGAKPFESICPLPEVIAASVGASAAGKRVQAQYMEMLAELGPEFAILREVPLSQIGLAAGPCVEEGIRRLRAGEVERVPGFDGQFGKITLLSPSEIEVLSGQVSLFGASRPGNRKKGAARGAKGPAGPGKKAVAAAPSVQEGPILNEEQRQAVMAEEPAVAVIAGPGTGKTGTLVARIAHLIEERGVRPTEITAVTFTNQAAAELRARLEGRLGGKRALRGLTVGTFHAICRELLGGAALIGEGEALALAAQIAGEMGLQIAPRKVLEGVSRIKAGGDPAGAGVPLSLFEEYGRRLRAAGLRDFDDLLLDALALDTAGKRCFRHLLVDEFQDVSDLEYRLVARWSQGGTLFVIGDPDQSIYGFRGAEGRCFERLRAERPALREIALVKNYRSTPQVLGCALPLIAHNPGGARRLEATCPDGPAVRLLRAGSEFSQGIALAKEIGRMTGGMDMLAAGNRGREPERLRAFSEMAVLCRTHRQLETVEECLRHDGIPCVIAGREDFLQAERVRGALGFFRSLLEPGDPLAAQLAEVGAWDLPALEAAFGGQSWVDCWLAAAGELLPRAAKEKPRKLLERWVALCPGGGEKAVERLLAMAIFSPTMPAFLETLLLGREGDIKRASGREYASGAVSLMTLHGAKGLEFPVVFLAGFKDRSIPLESGRGPVDREEERRLCYVGMTRAKEELILAGWGDPSPFERELPAGACQVQTVGETPAAKQLTLF